MEASNIGAATPNAEKFDKNWPHKKKTHFEAPKCHASGEVASKWEDSNLKG